MNAAAILLLAEKGLSAHDIAAVAMALEADRPKPNTAAEKRKAWDRERKAEKRAEAKSGGMSGGNPPDPAPNEIDILTPTREEKTEAKASSKTIEREKRAAIASCLKAAFVLPDDIDAEAWAGWEEMRRRLRKAPTDHARTLAVTELRRLRDEEGWPPGVVLNHCTMNSYQGIYPPKAQTHGQSTSNVTSLRGSRPDPALDMWRSAVADENEENNLRAGPPLPALGSGGP